MSTASTRTKVNNANSGEMPATPIARQNPSKIITARVPRNPPVAKDKNLHATLTGHNVPSAAL